MKGIKAFQGYMSDVMEHFYWLDSFELSPYKDMKKPLVVFGCYRPKDYETIVRHRGEVIVVWMGNDTIHHKDRLWELKKSNITHVTWLIPVKAYLESRGVDCLLIKNPIKEHPYPEPVSKLGQKVYAYLPKGKPEYHGSNVVDTLNIKYPLFVGNKSIPRLEWYKGANQAFYSQAFIGLALSSYAGGGMTIQEMAVRGIRVITNVSPLPNCIPWKTKEDVERIINNEAEKIGQSNNGLVKEVYDSLVYIKGCFDLDKLLT